MVGLSRGQWDRLEELSPLGFLIGGLGLFLSFGLVAVRDVLSMTVPELLISVIALPSMAIIFFVGLLGYYPHVSTGAPRLGIGGALAAGLGGLVLVVTTIGAIILHFTTTTGFTQAEDNPLFLVLFFVMLGTFFLSFLLYGIGSTWSGHPSQGVGVLLLIAAIEPGSGLLFDVVGIDLGDLGPVLTLGIAALAMVAAGYLLLTGRGISAKQ